MTINAGTGARTITGGLTAMPASPGGRGYFAGAGSGGQQVIINLTPPTVLTNCPGEYNPGGDDGPRQARPTRNNQPRPRLTFYVGVGGTILVAANQPDGDYQSTFEITADYQ